MPAVGGFVFDSAGAPVDRELRIYRRDTGALLGNARSSGGGGDLDFGKVALLLHGDGANGSTTFTDSSAVPKTVAALGGAVVSTAQSKWGGASISSENTAGARVQINSHADFNMGAGDFTVECWAYVVARNASNFESFVAHRITTGYYGFWLCIDQATGYPEFSMCNTSLSIFRATSTTTFPLGQWVHLAGVRNGSQITLFVNGVQAAITAVSGTNYGSTEPVLLFGASDGDARFKLNGYVDDLRITKGVARYTSNFTPPSTPFPDMSGADRTLAFGEYYFATTHTGEVQVVCMDDASGPLENDLILRTFPV